jgi:hypothetical protein
VTDPQDLTDPGRPRRGDGRLAVAVRTVVWLDALAVLAQAVFAGRILGGDDAGPAAHVVGAGVVALLSLGLCVLALVAWRRRALPARTAGTAAFILTAVLAQVAAGEAGELAVHVPLGVLIFGGLLWTGLAWPVAVRP